MCVCGRCGVGARLIGELDRSGVGETVVVDTVKSLTGLRASIRANNEVLVRQLREDDHSQTLLEMARDEVELGRLSLLAPLDQVDTGGMLLNPRFGVAQQKESGEWKVHVVCTSISCVGRTSGHVIAQGAGCRPFVMEPRHVVGRDSSGEHEQTSTEGGKRKWPHYASRQDAP